MPSSSTSMPRPGVSSGRSTVFSVDTKKKELIGAFKNGGSDYGRRAADRGQHPRDFENQELGKVVPYGSTISAPTWAMSALESIMIPANSPSMAFAFWLDRMGRERYPTMTAS